MRSSLIHSINLEAFNACNFAQKVNRLNSSSINSWYTSVSFCVPITVYLSIFSSVFFITISFQFTMSFSHSFCIQLYIPQAKFKKVSEKYIDFNYRRKEAKQKREFQLLYRRVAFEQLKKILNSSKIKILKCYAEQILFYGCRTWALLMA